MNYTNDNPHVRQFYDYALQSGWTEETFFHKNSSEHYIETSVDAYHDYALFRYLFKNKDRDKAFSRMMSVDFRSRLGHLAGIASSDRFESVMLMEPPEAKKVGMIEYFGVGRPSDYKLLFYPSMHRMERFEHFSLKKRKPYLDNNTWYIYIFATKKELQGQGYGKKLMNLFLSFVKEKGYRICLETNERNNVRMYRRFGFELVDSLLYEDAVEHYVMRF